MERVGRVGREGGGRPSGCCCRSAAPGRPIQRTHARAAYRLGRHTPARESRESRGGREMMLTFGARARLYDAYFTVILYSTVLCGDSGAY